MVFLKQKVRPALMQQLLPSSPAAARVWGLVVDAIQVTQEPAGPTGPLLASLWGSGRAQN